MDQTVDMSVPGSDLEGDQYFAIRPVILPRLRRFTEPELSFWLSSRLPAPKANLLSQRLMATTEGIPHALYAILADHALWEQ
jgi:hypothetical protein